MHVNRDVLWPTNAWVLGHSWGADFWKVGNLLPPLMCKLAPLSDIVLLMC